MFTIKNAAEVFSKVDNVDLIKNPAFGKQLRNISQRYYLPTETKVGNADGHELPAICTLRLMQKALEFGLDKRHVQKLAKWLQNAESMSESKEPLPDGGGWRILSPMEEAIKRVRKGEEFDFHISMDTKGKIVHLATWKTVDISAGTKQLLVSIPKPINTVVVSLKASGLISQILPLLDELNSPKVS